ncbi:MAG: hypothetical protein B6U89_03920 [Desulfurococcales archaeon ex4484_58]|nr:MAG: hypothetical protein B6U89_03920 [Desulfurococcales archaeon ex4484_58]
MRISKRNVLILFVLIAIAIVLFVGELIYWKIFNDNYLKNPQYTTSQEESCNKSILFIGNTRILNTTYKKLLEELGSKCILVNKTVYDIDYSLINNTDIILLDTLMIKYNLNNKDLHEFIKESVKSGKPIYAVGDETSLLFELLSRAGVYNMTGEGGIERNPAHFNPPLAGYYVVINENGEIVTDKIIITNSTDTDTQVDLIINS